MKRSKRKKCHDGPFYPQRVGCGCIDPDAHVSPDEAEDASHATQTMHTTTEEEESASAARGLLLPSLFLPPRLPPPPLGKDRPHMALSPRTPSAAALSPTPWKEMPLVST